jgi:hypothetical protein
VKGRKPSKMNVHRAACHYVLAELLRRGAVVIEPKPSVDLAVGVGSRLLQIDVLGRTARTWQGHIDRRAGDADFFVFVDLSGGTRATPQFWIVPASAAVESIRRGHKRYLEKHGGKRPKSPQSKHTSIKTDGLVQGRDRWDLLGLKH